MIPACNGTHELASPASDAPYRAAIAARDMELLGRAILDAWKRAGIEPVLGLVPRVVLTHYKPGHRARLLVRVEIPRPERRDKPRVQFLFVQAYPTLLAARRRLEVIDKRPLRCIGPPVFLVPEWCAVGWALPNGPLLRTAKLMFHRRSFTRFLVEAGFEILDGGKPPRRPELIRYVPRHRAVFRHPGLGTSTGRPFYIKFHAPGQDGAAASNLALAGAASSASGGAFEVPRLMAHVPRRRALVMKEVGGRRLTELDLVADLAAFRAVGRALAAFHASTLRVESRWSAQVEIAALRSAMDDLAIALPALRECTAALVAGIDEWASALRFPGDVPIHGNIFGDQILVTDDLHVGIVDWDDLCAGDPLFDVGRLVANILFLAQRRSLDATPALAALLDGYTERGQDVDAERLAWHAVTALLLRAKISALRSLPDSWLTDIQRSVEIASHILDSRRLETCLEEGAMRQIRTPK